MLCSQQLSYIIRPGDNLYHLAQHFQTTVPMILSKNPSVDPYNLQIGSTVIICPGDNFTAQSGDPNPPVRPDPSGQINMINDMRLVWEHHVYWTRMLLISIAERLKDQSAVANRLLQNPNDMANIFAYFYTDDAAQTISRLLKEHLNIGASLITALRDGQTAQADELNRQWYINADEMAEAFSGLNPYYDIEDVRGMLYSHLDLAKQEVAMRLAGNYAADIAAFNKVEQEAMVMADYFSSGIMWQFPQKLN